MAEEPESALQLPPSSTTDGEGPTEVSPETATPEPPSSAAVSPGTEEPAGDTKKKSNFESSFFLGSGGRLRVRPTRSLAANKEAKFRGGLVPGVAFDLSGERKCSFRLSRPLSRVLL